MFVIMIKNKHRKTHQLCIISFTALLLFNACSAQFSKINKTENTLSEYIPKVVLPAQNIPLPAKDFSFCMPEKKLEDMVSPKVEITQIFSSRETKDIVVRDLKLFQNSNKLTINLNLIEEEDFAFPLADAIVISPYGGKRRGHTGVDLKTCPNDTIVSAFDGVVRMAKPYAGYGNVIVVRHYNGIETIYSHNSKNFVKPNDIVKAGQPIGLTGRTGRASTAHLHFETRINGQHFNPNIIFNLKSQCLQPKRIVCTKTSGGSIAVRSAS